MTVQEGHLIDLTSVPVRAAHDLIDNACAFSVKTYGVSVGDVAVLALTLGIAQLKSHGCTDDDIKAQVASIIDELNQGDKEAS